VRVSSKITERRRLNKKKAYHEGAMDAISECIERFGDHEFFENRYELHKDKIEEIEKRLKGLPQDEEEC
jgi:hypothetical protein